MGIANIITGPVSDAVHTAMSASAVRDMQLRHTTVGDAFDSSWLVSVDRTSGSSILVPETEAATRALADGGDGRDRRARDVIRAIVRYGDDTGRPVEGVGLGRTGDAFVAARATSSLQELAAAGTQLDASVVHRALRSATWHPLLLGTHERGRIFLAPRIANVLLHPNPSRLNAASAREAVEVVDHELAHVANARTSRPLGSGATAEAFAQLRTHVGDARIAPLQAELELRPGTATKHDLYVEPTSWLRGIFERAGSQSDAAIAADLAAIPDDRQMLEHLAARLIARHGIHESYLTAMVMSLHAPSFPDTAARTLAELDSALANTPRGTPIAR